MDLLQLAKQLKEKGFDPKKEEVEGYLPDGKYNVVLEHVEPRESAKGWQYISMAFRITSGEYARRVFYTSIHFMDEWNGRAINEKTIENNLKTFQRIMVLAEKEVKQGDFNDYKTIAKALKCCVGDFYGITKKTNKAKNGNEYENYYYGKADNVAVDMFPDGPIDIDDSDLPF